MSIPATTTFAIPDPSFCPTTFGETIEQLNLLVETVVDETLTPYVVSDATPAVDQQAYLWLKTIDEKPTGLYKFYNGTWRLTYTGRIGDIKMFSGDPTGLFDSQGLGVAGGDQDGWHFCNGAGGTINLTDQFVVGADMNPVGATQGWSGTAWESTIRGTTASNGGFEQITLDENNTYRPARPEIAAWEWEATGNAGMAGGPLFGEEAGHDTGAKVTFQTEDAGNTSPDPIWIIPPYVALAFLQFVGYD